MTEIVFASKKVPSVLRLAKRVDARIVNPAETKYIRPLDKRHRMLVINWGLSDWVPEHKVSSGDIYNWPRYVQTAARKDLAFRSLQNCTLNGLEIVPWTTDPRDAFDWHDGGSVVYARTLRRSRAGKGIELIKKTPKLTLEDFLAAYGESKLFTRYIKPEAEYRVHVWGDQVIDFTRKKRRRLENPPPNRFWIRSYHNGWIMARKDVDLPECVEAAGIQAVKHLGLHFGAADILYINRARAVVLEVNTAPGLSGTTLEAYENAIKGEFA